MQLKLLVRFRAFLALDTGPDLIVGDRAETSESRVRNGVAESRLGCDDDHVLTTEPSCPTMADSNGLATFGTNSFTLLGTS